MNRIPEELRSLSDPGRKRTGFLVIVRTQGRGHHSPESRVKKLSKEEGFQNLTVGQNSREAIKTSRVGQSPEKSPEPRIRLVRVPRL